MRGKRLLTLALLALALVSACATAIGGSPVPAPGAADGRPSGTPNPRPTEPTALTLLGELATIDPCSLTDTAAFSAFGTATVTAPDSLDDCRLEIRTPELVTFYVGSLDRIEALPDINAKKSITRPGGLKIVDYATDPNYCNQLLVFVDGVTLSVNASRYDGPEPKLCEMVHAGMDQVLEVLVRHAVRHRDFAANSLGSLDPCRLVPAAALASIPGIGAAAPRTYPAGHGCAWTAPDNSARVRVMFTAGPPPKPSGAGSNESPIAGRASVLSPTPEAGNYAFCGAQTGHIPLPVKGLSGLVEIAAVFVRMPKGQVDAACRAATEVAGAVWPKLPNP